MLHVVASFPEWDELGEDGAFLGLLELLLPGGGSARAGIVARGGEELLAIKAI